MRNTIALFAVLVTCVACPRAPYKVGIVSLSFPQPVNRTVVTPSVNDAEIQAALNVIDGTLVSDGFVRKLKPPEAGTQGFLASYSKLDSDGLVLLNLYVSLEDGSLRVARIEGRSSDNPITVASRKIVHLLRMELVRHYGKA